MNNRDRSAFGEAKRVGDVACRDGGLTKREYAAIKIAAGFAASDEIADLPESMLPNVVRSAIKWADMLLDELEKDA